jgi:MoaA/NifB/PqqE/SkfB family radical SAM enzyme
MLKIHTLGWSPPSRTKLPRIDFCVEHGCDASMLKIVNPVYNAASTSLEYDLVEPVCNRAKLDTGTHCNYRCGFCYYKQQLTEITPVEEIYKRIDYLHACGITEVDLSGGESSIHKHWFDILDYCSALGMKISTLSNGYKFADIEFLRASQTKGLTEILFSVHGFDRDSHNEMVGNRHGYDKIVQAVHNAHKLGITVRINCTVTHTNYEHVDVEFVDLMLALRPYELNFLTLNYWGDAHKQQCIDYAVVTPHIHRAIDALVEQIPIINVRYTPYCFMKGYEKHVCNYYQHIYDVYDWNIAVYDYTIDPATYRADPIKALYQSARDNRMNTYYKTAECVKCKHYFICDGVEKNITNITVRPEPGERISQVNFYRRGWYGNPR